MQLGSTSTRECNYNCMHVYWLTSPPRVAYTRSEHVIKVSVLLWVSVARCSYTNKYNKTTYHYQSYHKERDIRIKLYSNKLLWLHEEAHLDFCKQSTYPSWNNESLGLSAQWLLLHSYWVVLYVEEIKSIIVKNIVTPTYSCTYTWWCSTIGNRWVVELTSCTAHAVLYSARLSTQSILLGTPLQWLSHAWSMPGSSIDRRTIFWMLGSNISLYSGMHACSTC